MTTSTVRIFAAAFFLSPIFPTTAEESSGTTNSSSSTRITIGEPKWDAVQYMGEDRVVCKDGDNVVFVDGSGRETVSNVLSADDYLYAFSPRLLGVRRADKWGLFNIEEDEFEFAPAWDRLVNDGPWTVDKFEQSDSGVIWVKRDENWGVLDLSGKEILAPARILDPRLPRLIEGENGEPDALVSVAGEVIGEWPWGQGLSYEDDYVKVSKTIGRGKKSALKYGIVDAVGKVVIQPEWDDVLWEEYTPAFSCGLVAVNEGGGSMKEGKASGGKWGFVDKSGKVVIPPAWDATHGFRDGIALVQKGGLWGIISIEGEVLVPPRWEDAAPLSHRRAWVAKNGKWGLVDSSGAPLTKFEWNAPKPRNLGAHVDFTDGLLLIQSDAAFAFINPGGQFVYGPSSGYGKWFNGENGVTFVSDSDRGKTGLINTSGEWVYEAKEGVTVWSPEFVGGRYIAISSGYGDNRKWGFVLIAPRDSE